MATQQFQYYAQPTTTTTTLPPLPPPIPGSSQCPSGYFIPASPTTTDTGLLLLTMIVPVVLFTCLNIGWWVGMRDSWRFMSVCQQTIGSLWTEATFIMLGLSIGFSLVHTAREADVEYYNTIVREWEGVDNVNDQYGGGKKIMQGCASFQLEDYSGNNILPLNNFTTTLVQPFSSSLSSTTSDILNAHSVHVSQLYYNSSSSSSSPPDLSRYTFLRSKTGGQTSQRVSIRRHYNYSSNSSTQGYPFMQNYSESIYCNKAFCSASYCGRDTKKHRNYGYCITDANSSSSAIRDYCKLQGGFFRASSSSAFSCGYNRFCGTCTYPTYLNRLCFVIDRYTSGVALSSTFGACDYPFSNGDSLGVGAKYISRDDLLNGDVNESMRMVIEGGFPSSSSSSTNSSKHLISSWPPTFTLISVFSVADPFIRIQMATGGTFDFGLSTEVKYRQPARIMWIVFGVLLFGLILFISKVERRFLFNEEGASLRGFTRFFGTLFDPDDLDHAGERRNLLGAGAAGNTNTVGDDDDDIRANHNITTSQESLARELQCIVCLENPRNQRLLPCRHNCLCEFCCRTIMASRVNQCPLCRTPIENAEYCRPEEPTFAVFERNDSSSSSENSTSSPHHSLPHHPQASSPNSGAMRNLTCCICLENNRDRVFRPCNHHLCCEGCAQLMLHRPCPICRTVISSSEPCDPYAPTFVRF